MASANLRNKKGSIDLGLAISGKAAPSASEWTREIENTYRLRLAGYQNESEYRCAMGKDPECWPESGLVKKLQRKDGCFYYYNKTRECSDKDVAKIARVTA